MVFYFEPRGKGPGKDDWLIYMGKDKYENEELIKYGMPMDIWFHVDNLSSAHVYLRLPREHTVDDIPPDTLEDCIQLVKANSIQGHKMNNIDVVYTPWTNLRKTAGMDVGQIGFHDNKLVKKVSIEKKNNDILNRLNKTKTEAYPDLAAERVAYDKEMSAAKKKEVQTQKKLEAQHKAETEREKDLRSYKALHQEDNMLNTKDIAEKYSSFQDYEDDFM